MPFYGAVIVCLDDPNVQGILPSIKRRTITYGTTAQADMEATEITCSPFASDFRLRFRGADLGAFHLRIPGRHNVLNAMAAVAVALELEVKPERSARRWPPSAAWTGASRCAAKNAASPWWTITAIIPPRSKPRSRAPGNAASRRVHVLFQPHRYTRTFHLMDEFARAFNQADTVFVMDIYAASEKPIEGVTAEALVERIRQFGHRGVEYVGTMDCGVDALLKVARAGDVVLTLGAGSISQAAEKLLEKLREKADG